MSGSSLKVIAILSMLIDHVGGHILRYIDICKNPFWYFRGEEISIYWICRTIGRMAFPIYCFLLVEGFLYTRNRVDYGKNLIIFAIVSEIPWDLVHSLNIIGDTQNVFFTLFLGYLGMCIIESYKGCKKKRIIGIGVLAVVSLVMNADYGFRGFAFILMMYGLRNCSLIRAVVGMNMLSSSVKAGLAFVPIAFYNGKRGFIKGRILKYAFYWFYPVHLLILAIFKIYITYKLDI